MAGSFLNYKQQRVFLQCLAHTAKCANLCLEHSALQELDDASKGTVESSVVATLMTLRSVLHEAMDRGQLPNDVLERQHELLQEDRRLLKNTFMGLPDPSADDGEARLIAPLTYLVEGLIERYQNEVTISEEIFKAVIGALQTDLFCPDEASCQASPSMLCIIDITNTHDESSESKSFAVGTTRPTVDLKVRKGELYELWAKFLNRFHVEEEFKKILNTHNELYKSFEAGRADEGECLVWHTDGMKRATVAWSTIGDIYRHGCRRCTVLYSLSWWKSTPPTDNKHSAALKPPCAESYALSNKYSKIVDGLAR